MNKLEGKFKVGANSDDWWDDDKQNHILMLDYDDMVYEEVAADVLKLQMLGDLPDVLIMKTKKGFHALCFTKLSLSELYFLVCSSKADEQFKNVMLINRHLTLRVTSSKDNKIEYFSIIKNTSKHRKFYQSAKEKYLGMVGVK